MPRSEDREWEELLRYGERRARELGIRPADVARLVEEYRAEVRAAGGMMVGRDLQDALSDLSRLTRFSL